MSFSQAENFHWFVALNASLPDVPHMHQTNTNNKTTYSNDFFFAFWLLIFLSTNDHEMQTQVMACMVRVYSFMDHSQECLSRMAGILLAVAVEIHITRNVVCCAAWA